MHDSAEKFFELAIDLCCVAGIDGYFKQVNPAFEKVLGWSGEDLLGRPFTDFIHPDDVAATLAEVKKLNEGVPTLSFENRYRCRDGSYRNLSWTAMQDEHSGLLYAIARDNTVLRQADDLARTALEASLNAMIISDKKGIITLVNAQAEKYFGYRREELLGKPIDILVPESLQKAHVGNREEYFQQPEERPMALEKELYARRKDGSLFPVEIGLNPVHTGQGTFVLAVVADITDRKKAEAALHKAKDEAERANRLKSEFLNLMSHELRTPLTVMLGNLPLLTDPQAMPDADEVAEIARDIEDSAQHLLTLINDLLDISKIEAGKLELHPERLQLEEVAANVITAIQTLADQKGLLLETEIANGEVRADRVRLKQILLNLLSNAVKFTDEGKVILRIRRQKNEVDFRVEDTGCGIREENLPDIFEMFKQMDTSSTRKAAGSGLGLLITKRLVEMHGGSIDVMSTVGKGSVFRFSIPG